MRDSYTIGQNVCETCRLPYQLKEGLESKLNTDFELQIIAQTEWTTINLKNTIAAQNPSSDFDLITLLIGVNNQHQNKPFSLYELEFPELLATAIILAKDDKNNVIVVSIPDYAFTTSGNGLSSISTQIDAYNALRKIILHKKVLFCEYNRYNTSRFG